MFERNALFKELAALSLYANNQSDLAESEIKINPTDERIDVDAKYSLMRLLKGNAVSKEAATGLINTINAGELGGIYGDSMMASVKYAKGHHTNWWLMISKGEDGCLVLNPNDLLRGVPTVIFRSQQNAPPFDGVRKIPARLDSALIKAWQTFKRFKNNEFKTSSKVTYTASSYDISKKGQDSLKNIDNPDAPKNIYPLLPLVENPVVDANNSPDLTAPLTDSEWRTVDLWLSKGEVIVDPLTKSADSNAKLIASRIFCERALRSPDFNFKKEDPFLCTITDVTKEDERVKQLAKHVAARGDIINWTDISFDDRYSYIMSVLVLRHSYPVQGAAGIVGNLRSESHLLPNAIEGCITNPAVIPMKTLNWQGGYSYFTAEEAMNRIDRIDKKAGPKCPGIGLAQWTLPKRRRGLFKFRFRGENSATSKSFNGAAILFYVDAQINYLVCELNDPSNNKFNLLNKALLNENIKVEQASKRVLFEFENPRDKSAQVIGTRLSNSRRAIICYNNHCLMKCDNKSKIDLDKICSVT